MNNEILFTERQKFNQWWLWLIMMSINGILIFLVFTQPMNGNKINPGLLFGIGVNSLMTVLFFFCFRLDTRISNDGIYVRFFPFHFSFIKIEWDRIAKSYVREYRPIGEYGGWGLRYGFSGNGKAYNVSGNKGIQLIITDGSKLLIGTNKSEEVKEILKQTGHLSE
jgi:hypothetical protein